MLISDGGGSIIVVVGWVGGGSWRGDGGHLATSL